MCAAVGGKADINCGCKRGPAVLALKDQKFLVAEGDGEYQEQDDSWPEQYVDAEADKQAGYQTAYVVVGVTWRG